MNPITLKTDVLNNLPWQARPTDCTAPLWRYQENPIIRRNPIPGVARILIVQSCRMRELISVYSVANRPTAFRSSIWDAARTASTGNLSRKRLHLSMKPATRSCRNMHMTLV